MSRVRKLTDIEIDEVSVVDRPANQHGLIAFAKSLYGEGYTQEEGTMPPDADVLYDVDGDEVDPGLLEHGDVVYDETGAEYVFVEDDADDDYYEVGKAAPSAALRRAAARQAGLARQVSPAQARGFGGGYGTARGVGGAGARAPRVPESANRNLYRRAKQPKPPSGLAVRGPGTVAVPGGGPVAKPNLSTGPSNYQQTGTKFKPWFKYGVPTTLGLGAAGGAYALNKSAGDTVLEALSKAVTDDDRDEIIAKAMDEVEIYKAQTEEMADALAYEQDLRLTEAYISKASEYNLPVSPDVFGPILKSIAEALTDEELDILDAIFEAIGDTLYDEVGYVGDTDNGSVVDMVDAYADELVGKSDLTHAEAAVAMYTAHPEAYEAYLAENGR